MKDVIFVEQDDVKAIAIAIRLGLYTRICDAVRSSQRSGPLVVAARKEDGGYFHQVIRFVGFPDAKDNGWAAMSAPFSPESCQENFRA